MRRIPIGYLILTTTPPEDIPAIAKRIEELGFDELWVAEDYFLYGGFTAAEKALAATDRIVVNLGVVSSVARHPAVTAMEISNLARSYPGRVRIGIGHGVPAWTNQMGLTPKSPLKTLRACLTSVRSLLEGKSVDNEDGPFIFRSVKLSHPVKGDVPLLTGVVGPKSLELSGEIASGTIMSVLSGPQYLSDALSHIRTGMAKSGHADHLVPTFVLASVDNDRTKAREAIRPILATYIEAMTAHSPLVVIPGFGSQAESTLSKEGVDGLVRTMPDDWIDEMAIAGNPDDFLSGIMRLHDCGATSIVLTFNPDTAEDELKLVSEIILPRLRS